MNKNRRKLNIIPIFGFLSLILIGAILLKLPICNQKPISFIDSLFVSTSGVCITGYTPVVLADQFTLLGQIIILILVQIGALGFMTIIVFIITSMRKKLNFSEILLIEDGELNIGFKEKAKKIIKYTFIIEFTGAALLSLRFMQIYGFIKGIWYGIFHAVTAFCNSGYDILGANSFESFTNDYYINFIIMTLIIIGGIGFLVFDDIINCLKTKRIDKIKIQTKIVLITTGILLVASTIYIKIMDPKLTILQSMFTAVTLRTAGFSTINMAECSQATKMIGVILMFIGGAPGSTSGGIRIITFSILILTIISTIKNRREVVVFYRRINQNTIMKAVTITGWSILAVFMGIITMSYFNDLGLQNIIFHCVGAFSDTGLGLISTSLLNNIGKITIMVLMFIGRLGPIVAFRVFFDEGKQQENIKYIDADLML